MINKKKFFVLDTNVLLSNPDSFLSFNDSNIIIPFDVLIELDENKKRLDAIGINAREVSRKLCSYINNSNFFSDGIKLENNSTLKIKHNSLFNINSEYVRGNTDNSIIELMVELNNNKTSDEEYVLITDDINLRVRSNSLGIKTENYNNPKFYLNDNELFKGVINIETTEENIKSFYKDGFLSINNLKEEDKKIFPNQFVIMKQFDKKNGSAISRFDGKETLQQLFDIKCAFGLKPRNKEQKFALDILFDKNINLVTLTGLSGTGKSILSLASGIHQLLEEKKYEKLIVMRPVQPLGKDIGFLPGTLKEKLEPWIGPIKDNLEFLFSISEEKEDIKLKKYKKNSNDYLQLLIEKGKIEVEAMTYIRGRSIANAFILVDEAQNATPHELKTVITRVGEGTKIVMTGDLYQVDNPHLNLYSNGLTYVIEKFKSQQIASHITLLKGERSPLATLAAEIL